MSHQPSKRLFLLRHGRTEWNHTRRAQGQADVPLDEVGHAQAQAAAPRLALVGAVRLWSSDLARARQTADHVAAATGLKVEEDPRLREFSVGEREGMTWDQAVAQFPQMADGISLGERLKGVPGAEGDDDVRARIVPAVEDCFTALAWGETGIAVSHGAALKIALGGLLGWDDHAVRSLGVLDNCHWATVLEPGEGRARRLLAYGVGDFASATTIG